MDSNLSKVTLVILLAAFFVINGCVVGPDFVKPKAATNENWSLKDDPRVVTEMDVNRQWWTTFNDPTLTNLIEIAYQQNLTLRIEALRIIESRARLAIAIGNQYPQVQEAFGSITNEGLSRNAPNAAMADRNHWNYEVGFDAVWELDFWGKFRRGVESETANWMASITDYDFATVSLTAEVARTYTVIRTFEVLIALADENIRVQEEGLQIANSRFVNGATTELDVTQARTLLASTKATVPKLQTSLIQAQNALSTLLGRPVGDIETLLKGPNDIPVAPSDIAMGVPAELLRRRPDIRSAELYAAAQSARIGIAKADFYPSLSLFGEIGFQTSSNGGVQSNNAGFNNLFDRGSIFYTFGPTFQWPIFNYGRIANNVRVEDARFQQSIVNYQNTVLTAIQEVEDSLAGFLKSQEAAVFEQNSVDAAKRSVELSMLEYREGAQDYQRVLDAQRSLLEQENNLAQTRSSISTNLIGLYKALGGGWELRQDKMIVPESTIAEMKARTDWGKMLPARVPDTVGDSPTGKEVPLLQKPQ
ncbi:MAG: efflux transporter outer membrane subunit [Phycisphaerales bacterium]